jgi:hypothetical protein
MEITVFWDVTPRSLRDNHRRFGETWCHHLHGRRTLSPDDEGSKIFFCNIYNDVLYYTASDLKDSDRCESLKSHIHHSVHESTQLDHNLSHLNPVHNFTLCG